MPMQLESHSHPAAGPFLETSTGGHVDFSRSGDVFVSGAQRIENHEIMSGPEYLRATVRDAAYNIIHAARAEQFERNEVLLKAANINVHDTGHQDRDARVVAWLFDVFADKLNPNLKEPAILGAMIHDREYIPAARNHAKDQLERLREQSVISADTLQGFARKYKPLLESRERWMQFLHKLELLESGSSAKSADLFADGSFPSQIGKPQLDPHAELGEKRIREWYRDEVFSPAFGDWTDEQKEIAALTIRDHSNGSAYNPFTARREAQLLRLADKLDNTHHRIRESMLTRESERDPMKVHRYVPSCIMSYALGVDRSAKTFTVEYDVNVQHLTDLMHRDMPEFTYDNDQFLKDFQRAYGEKSMRIAAEVAYSLFADDEKEEMYSPDATFKVVFKFADGTTSEESYTPLPTSPTFS